MRVTVAICTWNRAALLDRTLAELRGLRIPPGVEWELLVVNNHCTDATDEVIARHAPRLPLHRLFEPELGLTHARNRAVAAATGELVLWTDDDVLVSPEWLSEYVVAAERWADATFFGGTVDSWFEGAPPRWVARNLSLLERHYSLRQLGAEVRPLKSQETPYGANMAFRRRVFDSHRFDARRGVTGNQRVQGEETLLIRQLQEAGQLGVWVGTARVRHFIPRERMTKRFVWDWCRGLGRLFVHENPLPPAPLLGGVPRWVLRQYWQSRLRAWCLAPFPGPGWLRAYMEAAKFRGIIDEVRSTAAGREHRPRPLCDE